MFGAMTAGEKLQFALYAILIIGVIAGAVWFARRK